MFSLILGLWNYLFSKAELHILIVGLDDAGKTVRESFCMMASIDLSLVYLCLDIIGAIERHIWQKGRYST
jgi:hypothetical protein